MRPLLSLARHRTPRTSLLLWFAKELRILGALHKVNIPMQNCRHWFYGISTMLNSINDDTLISFSIRIDFMQ